MKELKKKVLDLLNEHSTRITWKVTIVKELADYELRIEGVTSVLPEKLTFKHKMGFTEFEMDEIMDTVDGYICMVFDLAKREFGDIIFGKVPLGILQEITDKMSKGYEQLS